MTSTLEAIPAIDLIDGNVVRLRQGDFARQTTYATSALKQAAKYADAGARWLHVVDLDGARHGSLQNLPVIAAIASETSLRIQAGGGIREREDIDRLLAAGVERVVIGSLAVRQTQQVLNWLDALGPDRICLAMDLVTQDSGNLAIATAGWQQDDEGSDWQPWLQRFVDAGLQHLLCTDIARDGMLSGPNLALYQTIMALQPRLRLIASGGIARASDLSALAQADVPAVVLGRALLDERISLDEVTPFLPAV